MTKMTLRIDQESIYDAIVEYMNNHLGLEIESKDVLISGDLDGLGNDYMYAEIKVNAEHKRKYPATKPEDMKGLPEVNKDGYTQCSILPSYRHGDK
jgi:hypothetical protein